MKHSRISVLHFSNKTVRGGAEEHMLALLRSLDRRYFRLHLVCPPECAAKLLSDLPEDVTLIPLCMQNLGDVRAAVQFARILRLLRVDILHSHMFHASLLASPIGWACRVPVILETPHIREAWRKGWLKGSFSVDRFMGRFVDYYIAVSEANARYLIEQKRLPRRKIIVIHNGCNLEQFDPSQPAAWGLKSSLGFKESDPVLVVLARLEAQKGHSVLIQALGAVRAQFPNVRLVCVGEGALRKDLENQVSRLGLEASVRFVGYQTNVPDWLALGDATVLPSLYEGLPLIAIESLAAGRPVVATAVDGTPEVVVNEKTGLTVPPGDAALLTNAICRILRDPGLRKDMAHAGRRWVLERFSLTRQVQETQEFYLSSLSRAVGTGGSLISRQELSRSDLPQRG